MKKVLVRERTVHAGDGAYELIRGGKLDSVH